MTTDPLNDALRDAITGALLGSTSVPRQTIDANGNAMMGTLRLEGIFTQRLRHRAFDGAFDDLLLRAMEEIDVSEVAKALEASLATRLVEALAAGPSGFGGNRNWLFDKVRGIAVEAATEAVKADEELLDRLRTLIGAQVDRDKIAVTVNITNPEPST